MIVIIEGVDGVGKTTIAKRFSEKYNFTYIKESYTNDSVEKEHRVQQLLERIMSGDNYIYDRTTLIDDFVYAFLNEDPSTLVEYQDIIISLLSKCVIFHLTIDDDIRKQRFEQRGDEYVTNDDIIKIRSEYVKFYFYLENVYYFELSSDVEKDVDNIMEVIKNDKNFTHCIK